MYIKHVHFNLFFETLGTRLAGLADNSGVVEVSPYVNIIIYYHYYYNCYMLLHQVAIIHIFNIYMSVKLLIIAVCHYYRKNP